MNTTAKTYVFNKKKTNKRALSITITKSREIQFSIYIEIYVVTQALLCKPNRQKLENMKHEANNTRSKADEFLVQFYPQFTQIVKCKWNVVLLLNPRFNVQGCLNEGGCDRDGVVVTVHFSSPLSDGKPLFNVEYNNNKTTSIPLFDKVPCMLATVGMVVHAMWHPWRTSRPRSRGETLRKQPHLTLQAKANTRITTNFKFLLECSMLHQ